jgi:hypothetical protein
VLDNGFVLLKDDSVREFRNQVNKDYGEPGWIGTLGSAFADKVCRVFRFAEEDKGLTIDFKCEKRTAEIKGKEPIKFYYLIQLRPAKVQTTRCYIGSENSAELMPITDKLDTVVEKSAASRVRSASSARTKNT